MREKVFKLIFFILNKKIDINTKGKGRVSTFFLKDITCIFKSFPSVTHN